MAETIYKIGNKILKIGGKLLTVSGGSPTPPTPPTPSLPPYTIRLRYTEGKTPTFSKGTAVQVSSSPNIWDLTYENSDWSTLLRKQRNLLEVVDANTAGVTNMYYLFQNCIDMTSVQLFDTSSVTDMTSMFMSCRVLTTVPLFDTSSVTNTSSMFQGCTVLTSVPLLDTSSVTDMSYMFDSCGALASVPLFDTSSVANMEGMFSCCYNVESGALALYQQASSKAIVPTHNGTFGDCGSNTVTGAAELAQIPGDWGGTGA